MRNLKSLLVFTLGIVLSLSEVPAISSSVLAATSYPSKPVRLIIPYPPGGATDVMARQIGTKLSERLGKPVVVDNRGGAGGIIGTEMVANAAPDGHTLLFAQAALTVYPSLQKLSFDPVKSFIPIVRLGSGPNALVVNPSVPAHSVKELIALAKRKPGELLFVTAGVSGIAHLGTELFKLMADIDITIVHFKGGGPLIIDLLGGHSHAWFGSFMSTLPHIKSGKLRALGTGGLKRSALLPDVPTIAESGLPGYESTQWWGILAPAGTPMPIIDRLSAELKAILTSNEIEKWFLTQGVDTDYMGAIEFRRFIAEDITKWSGVIKRANIKVEY